MTINKDDLGLLTEFWMRETNLINDKVDAMVKSAQDHSYYCGYRRGREDLIEIRKQRDELLESLTSLFEIGQVFSSAIEQKDYSGDFEEWGKKAKLAIAKATGAQN